MGGFGTAALNAHKLATGKHPQDPSDAWDQATTSIWGGGTSSQVKSCPKNAFLGLCAAGMVKGVASGKFTRSRKNKKYAVKAADMLKVNSSLVSLGEKGLWQKVMKSFGEPVDKVHNQQMDVVLTLFQNKLIQ